MTLEYIYGLEPFFNKTVYIAVIDHKNKEVRPCHGYFPPHKHSNYSKRIAINLSYTYNSK